MRERIQKGIGDLELGKLRPGKQVLDDLAFKVAVKEGLAEIQEGIGRSRPALRRRYGG